MSFFPGLGTNPYKNNAFPNKNNNNQYPDQNEVNKANFKNMWNVNEPDSDDDDKMNDNTRSDINKNYKQSFLYNNKKIDKKNQDFKNLRLYMNHKGNGDMNNDSNRNVNDNKNKNPNENTDEWTLNDDNDSWSNGYKNNDDNDINNNTNNDMSNNQDMDGWCEWTGNNNDNDPWDNNKLMEEDKNSTWWNDNDNGGFGTMANTFNSNMSKNKKNITKIKYNIESGGTLMKFKNNKDIYQEGAFQEGAVQNNIQTQVQTQINYQLPQIDMQEFAKLPPHQQERFSDLVLKPLAGRL